MSKCLFTHTQNFNLSLRKILHLFSSLSFKWQFGVYCHILFMKYLRRWGRMIPQILQKESRFWCCPVFRHVRGRWQNRKSAHVLSDSKSRLHFPQAVCHSRVTGYRAIGRLVNCYDLEIFQISVTDLQYLFGVACCFYIQWNRNGQQQWPPGLRHWGLNPWHFPFYVEDGLLGTSWPTLYLFAP